ncbi:MAG: CBS domain-containing protein [Asticcacaulis sp.]
MLVKDLMTTDFRLASPQTTLRQAAEMMRDGHYGYLPVGDKDHLIGAVTDRDIVVRGVASGFEPQTPIREVLSKTIVYCFEDDEVAEAGDLMKREQIRRLAVLNGNKRMVGIVTLGDIARITHNTRLTGDIEAEVAQH